MLDCRHAGLQVGTGGSSSRLEEEKGKNIDVFHLQFSFCGFFSHDSLVLFPKWNHISRTAGGILLTQNVRNSTLDRNSGGMLKRITWKEWSREKYKHYSRITLRSQLKLSTWGKWCFIVNAKLSVRYCSPIFFSATSSGQYVIESLAFYNTSLTPCARLVTWELIKFDQIQWELVIFVYKSFLVHVEYAARLLL